MTIANMLSITSSPILSMTIWIALLLAALYFARKPFHRTVGSLSRIIHSGMRLTAASVLAVEKRLVQRNRDVLMAAGLENSERVVEREFDRINAAVVRDLQGYPNLHRQVSEVINLLDEDYAKSADVPPSLPNWIPIIESIAKIDETGDSMVSNMLKEINRTLEEQQKSATETYRTAVSARHAVLNKMLPRWRKVQKTLEDIGKSVSNLNKRSISIDRYMDEYEAIRAQTDKAARMLSSSSFARFFIAGLVLLIATGGVILNFNLIALPMVEMVGGASYIGEYKTADVAVLVMIMLELTMGLFLLESLRITRLFPIIGSMDDKMRLRMIWITLTLLTILAGLESALAFASDRIAYEIGAFGQASAGAEQAALSSSMVPAVGKMILGFTLPFALAFVAIPLESFVFSARTVLGFIAAGLLRIIAFVLRLLGNVGYYAGRFVVNTYDLIIFPTIWLEGVITGGKSERGSEPEAQIHERVSIPEEAVDDIDDNMEYKEQRE